MQLSPEEKTFIGVFSGWLGSIILIVRSYTKMTDKVDGQDKRLAKVESRLVSPDGNPLLLSIDLFDKIRREDRAGCAVRCTTIDKRLDTHDRKFEQAVLDVATIKSTIASIETKLDLLLEKK